MARKYGKKNKIKTNIFDYNLGLIGESGIGKTTLAVQAAEKLVGEDGYLLLSLGKEDAVDAIPDAVYEEVPDYKTFDEITRDIIKNRDTDYKDLKVIIYDTLDQLIEICEPKGLEDWNEKQSDPQKRAESIAGAWGGFQKGEKYVVNEIILKRIWELKSVGVQMMVIGHTKRRTKTDPVTGEEFDVLTTDLPPVYFNAIKNKLHILGVASFDRKVKTKTSKNNFTGKATTTGKIDNEKRIITFRDDNFIIESKSRFDVVEDDINLDVDAWIGAIEGAIKAAFDKQKNNTQTFEEAKAAQEKEKEAKIADAMADVREKEKAKEEAEYNKIDVEENMRLYSVIRSAYAKGTEEQKAKAGEIIGATGFTIKEVENIPTRFYVEVAALFE